MPAPTIFFPKDFAWGAATAAYQIEGGYDEGGKGESIWDRFTHTPGTIVDASTGDVACDHYHRWREDIGLMASLGYKAYRFSISWPRIYPNGYGKLNPAGLDFYSGLVDGLLAAGIEPYVTLYHWDLPQALQEQGGWPARATAQAFADYAEAVVRRLGDRVKHWMTLNEPQVAAGEGYFHGTHAPGHHSQAEMMAASHHLLLGHGWAVPILRRDAPGSQVGIVLNLTPMMPASSSEADEQAAIVRDATVNRWYLDPLAGRGYPEEALAFYRRPMPLSPAGDPEAAARREQERRAAREMAFVREGDLKTIAEPVDFLGINNYTRNIIRSEEIPAGRNRPVEVKPGSEITEMGWEVYPEGLYDLLTRLKREYPFPAYYVTENGAAYPDQVGPNGEVDDPKRIEYLRSHIDAAGRALRDGVPLKGYFAWSFMDNFEWAKGYTVRFGLVYVDYPTEKRIPKASAEWYGRVIAENAL